MALDPAPRRAANADRLNLMTKVARLYHEQGLRQPEIAQRLHVSQSRVSRLLKEAADTGIVRTVVIPPAGVYSEIEDALRDRFGLADAVITEAPSDSESALLSALGGAGAQYLEATLTGSDRIGISSWSSTLLATVDSMQPRGTRSAVEVVQLIGGVGSPSVQVQATHLAERLAQVTGADARFLPAPGIVASPAVRDALLGDRYIGDVAELWAHLTVALVGIGSLEPSPLLESSGNAVSAPDRDALREHGAVGDVCLRFFGPDGELVDAELHDRVVGIGSGQLRAIPRIVGIAGGARKLAAIRAAAEGGWIHVLVTDLETARALLA
ncbi:sugar-binding transcriptional regulator [Homoserinibacter sp. YIM 151385]|uniref:sugar-binding transcriptional regulator n=1 Tax=Homoserinibacter sp. YIM 151385 TaxID=2985506 RepID=UPI0022EFDB6F|nr:sugar-binding transcriptional regulator [Homoserinibacter sp. YIM 151385]WBU37916.1 sugar-binding transcriptional regulator [Homoserinibacter sp. YIM 151385]